MIINLPDARGNKTSIKVDKESLELYFTNLLTKPHQLPPPMWFICMFCNKLHFFPLESSDHKVCNKCWKNQIGEEE